jgi:hypothetical protein
MSSTIHSFLLIFALFSLQAMVFRNIVPPPFPFNIALTIAHDELNNTLVFACFGPWDAFFVYPFYSSL